MDKAKVLTLHDYFSREIKHLLNPMGANRSSAIATKVTSVLLNSKRHDWGIEKDATAIEEILVEKITKYKDQELSVWYGDLKVMYDEDRERMVTKVIKFYIQRFELTDEEKAFYKEFQSQNY